MRKILHAIDSVNEKAGSISSWLVAVLIAIILYEVISRYVFNAPTPWAFGTFRMVGGAIIVMGWAYAQLHNSHVRVDVFYIRFSPRKRALIDVIGTGIFFFPLFGAFIARAGSSTWHTWLAFVVSITSYHLKSPVNLLYQTIILVGLCLFFLQFVARFIRDVYILARGKPL
jgi:TRAP-type mannitol/chloroaromatic compound transport system permease small subunit